MITDKDPLPQYGFILAGSLILVILLNSVLGQCLAGWRSPKTGRATATATAMSETTLRGNVTGAGLRKHVTITSDKSGWNNPFGDEHMTGEFGGDDGNDKRFDVASRSSYYSDEDTLGYGDSNEEGGQGNQGGAGGNDGKKSRYDVLREWMF